MRARCKNPTNPVYRHYGGRGISVCLAWQKSFTAFLADMGEAPPGLELDRINNDGNYEPGNCRWTTRKVQLSNRRKRQERTYRWRGQDRTLTQIASATDVSRRTLRDKLGATGSIDKAVDIAVAVRRNFKSAP
jgi:hypothetical protein